MYGGCPCVSDPRCILFALSSCYAVHYIDINAIVNTMKVKRLVENVPKSHFRSTVSYACQHVHV